MNLLTELRQDVAALLILKDWLGDGDPVSQDLAEKRALVCATCPENREPRWWERFKNPIATVMKRQLEIKHRVELATSLDGKLAVCRICGCCLPLVVWCPIEHLKMHTPETQIKYYPHQCWKRIEIENL